MGYRLENKDVDLSGLRNITYVPSKKAGDLFRYKNEVLRVFRNDESPIDEDTARYLTTISTSRVLLPRKLLFYNSAFKGYTMKLVPQKGSNRKIINAPKSDLLYTVQSVESDIDTLSQKKILLNNTGIGHTLYNGDLYLVDPSKYRIFDCGSSESLKKLNQYHLHLLLTELIATELRKFNFSQSEINHLKMIMELKDVDESTSEYLSSLIGDKKNIKEFVKKI